MLTTVALMAGTSVAACLVTLSRVIGWKRVLKHSTLIDVSFTAGTFIIFAGTLTGGLVAVLGGLIMALVLSIAKKLASLISGRKLPTLPNVKGLKGVANDPLWAFRNADGSYNEYDAKGNWIYNQAPYA